MSLIDVIVPTFLLNCRLNFKFDSFVCTESILIAIATFYIIYFKSVKTLCLHLAVCINCVFQKKVFVKQVITRPILRRSLMSGTNRHECHNNQKLHPVTVIDSKGVYMLFLVTKRMLIVLLQLIFTT